MSFLVSIREKRADCRIKTHNSSVIGLFLIPLLLSSGLHAATPDPEWPCVQALIPEVALATMWPVPLDEFETNQWRKDGTVAGLAKTLGDLESFTTAEEQLIDQFAETQPAATRSRALNLLAEGVVTEANRLRSKYIKGIKRYTRQQISIASQIEERLNELAAFDAGDESATGSDKGSENSATVTNSDRAEIEESLRWHERVYDQRERAIISLCERPVELEEKLSSVLRRLSMHIP